MIRVWSVDWKWDILVYSQNMTISMRNMVWFAKWFLGMCFQATISQWKDLISKPFEIFCLCLQNWLFDHRVSTIGKDWICFCQHMQKNVCFYASLILTQGSISTNSSTPEIGCPWRYADCIPGLMWKEVLALVQLGVHWGWQDYLCGGGLGQSWLCSSCQLQFEFYSPCVLSWLSNLHHKMQPWKPTRILENGLDREFPRDVQLSCMFEHCFFPLFAFILVWWAPKSWHVAGKRLLKLRKDMSSMRLLVSCHKTGLLVSTACYACMLSAWKMHYLREWGGLEPLEK